MRHGLRAALTPVVSQLGIDVGALLGGVIVVKQVFSLPGLGYDSVNAIATGNLPVIIGNIIVDLAYAGLDPRVRIS
jgi:peptide/nickel transport system permease protein